MLLDSISHVKIKFDFMKLSHAKLKCDFVTYHIKMLTDSMQV